MKYYALNATFNVLLPVSRRRLRRNCLEGLKWSQRIKPTFPNSNSILIIVLHFIVSLWIGLSRMRCIVKCKFTFTFYNTSYSHEDIFDARERLNAYWRGYYAKNKERIRQRLGEQRQRKIGQNIVRFGA